MHIVISISKKEKRFEIACKLLYINAMLNCYKIVIPYELLKVTFIYTFSALPRMTITKLDSICICLCTCMEISTFRVYLIIRLVW